jgi:prevent-host-death family protein
MTAVGIRELKAHASDLLRQVRERGETIDITYHGQVIAQLVPADRKLARQKEDSDVWVDIDQLAATIAGQWPEHLDAAEAISADRRDLSLSSGGSS